MKDIQNIIKEKSSRYCNIEQLLKLYNCKIIKETKIYISQDDENYCNIYEFLIGCETDNKCYILNANYQETPYNDYEPYYSNFKLKPFETEKIIDETNELIKGKTCF